MANDIVPLDTLHVNANPISNKGHLWYLTSTTNNTLPVLYRTNAKGRSPGNSSQMNQFLPVDTYQGIDVSYPPIDIVNDFDWTVSPKGGSYTARQDVPAIQITEKRILLNSNVSNIANSIYGVINNGGTLYNSLPGAAQTALAQAGSAGQNVAIAALNSLGLQGPATVGYQFGNNAGTSPLNNPGAGGASNNTSFLNGAPGSGVLKNNGAGGFVPSYQYNKAPITTEAVGSVLTNFMAQNGYTKFSNPALQPYNFLYSTKNTGFVYNLPYFENEYTGASVSMGSGGVGFAGEYVEDIASFADKASNFINILKPGIYIERSKQFSMTDTGRSIRINFPLLNTINETSIIQNWEFLFGLIYQNKPGRITRSIIDVPVIYEVNSPGLVYMPYAVISGLSVDFIGARRKMKLNVPVNTSGGNDESAGFTMIETVIPDAYHVSLTLTGLNEETRNFLYASINPLGVTTNPP